MIPLAEAIDDYLAMRRALGFKLAEHGRVLPQFAAFLAQRDESLITTALALSSRPSQLRRASCGGISGWRSCAASRAICRRSMLATRYYNAWQIARC